MGAVFLFCGLLLGTVNMLAGAAFILPSLIIFYYAPKWELRIEINGDSMRFSENVLETRPVELALAGIREIRRVEEKENRKGLLSTYAQYHAFVEFETRDGTTYRMHDIFDADFDAEILRVGEAAGISMDTFPLRP